MEKLELVPFCAYPLEVRSGTSIAQSSNFGNKEEEQEEEFEVWSCPNHPWTCRWRGIFSTCLRQRLSNLCPDYANLRPCRCSPSAAASTSLSKFFSVDGETACGAGSIAIGRVSDLIDSEPPFQRSRSVSASLFRSRPCPAGDPDADECSAGGERSRTASFWGMFRSNYKDRTSGSGFEEALPRNGAEATEKRTRMMRKSMSVALTSDIKEADVSTSAGGRRRS
ncbi:hypothetical protein SAY87_029516 [Trapa incisa]|uniref:Uncharacterized protein n=1 Tax=Trapa incisa TaxID=236973 RepID=A0AAN7KD09_9MYRT|nr:hypothetical protein SAY87_029516 [Trapa incisa]